MENRLFLYLDFLGFSELSNDRNLINKLFSILNNALIHTDSNFNTIVFSDTLLAYHKESNLEDHIKSRELKYLLELTQDLFFKLIHTKIFFRAIITEGEFNFKKRKNIDSYYGEALIEAYNAEKKLSGTGLFLDKKLRSLNKNYRFKDFSDNYDFIYLTHFINQIQADCSIQEIIFPSKDDLTIFPIDPYSFPAGIESYIYPEILHLQTIYERMHGHTDPKVREKYLTTWNMYSQAYPNLLKVLIDQNFDHVSISNIDWSNAKNHYYSQLSVFEEDNE